MFRMTIKTNILTIFLGLVGIVALSLLLSQYYFSKKVAVESTSKTFGIISKNIREHLRKDHEEIENILYTKSKYRDILEPITFDPFHPALESMVQILQIKNNLHAVYVAHPDGRFYEVVNMHRRKSLYKVFHAPPSTYWTVVTIIDNRQQNAFLDKDFRLIGRKVFHKKYDPRNRPWYKEAVASGHKEVVNTAPYFFAHTHQTGVTYAVDVDGNGTVLALDYTMDQLNQLLNLQRSDRHTEIFLADENGRKFASSSFQKEEKAQKNLASQQHTLRLTKEEEAYIRSHPELIVSNENDWPPFDFEEAGEPKGYTVDLLKLLAQKSGLKFRFTNGYQWAEIMEMFKKGEIDIVHSLYRTPEHLKIGLFTQPIYRLKNYFILPEKAETVESMRELEGKTVAVVKGWSIEAYLRKHYPRVALKTVENTAEAFLAVSQGSADLLIDTKESFAYMRRQLHLENLKLGGWAKAFDGGHAKALYMMVHPNETLLCSILNKSMDSISEGEWQHLQQKWFLTDGAKHEKNILNATLVQALLANKTDQILTYEEEGRHYFAIFNAVDRHTCLGIRVDADELLQPYRQNLRYSLLIALFLLLLALPVIFLSTNSIVRPIKALILENNKIKERKFSEVKPIDTYVIEFEALSDSLVSMSKSIQLYQESQEKLLDAMIKLVAEAIDAKSPYTGKHCERVPEIAHMLLDEANRAEYGPFKTFSLTSEESLKEFEIAAWLHDCGKVSIPEYVVDKSTKLETIYNRIHEIRMRFEVLWRDLQIACLKKEISTEEMEQEQEKLREEFAFIAEMNIGGEFMDEAKQQRIRSISQREWQRYFDKRLGLSSIEKERYDTAEDMVLPVTEKLLDDKREHLIPRKNFDYEAYAAEGFKLDVPKYLYNYGEIYNLCIVKGTLTPEERYKINEHVIISIKMLEKIPFPSEMSKIPEYAGSHHETLIGTGYPKKLTEKELSIPARIMAIADIFEALTASDRPYKKAKTLSEAIGIMHQMAEEQHIDKALFELFLRSGIYEVYAQKHLDPKQIDDIKIERYL